MGEPRELIERLISGRGASLTAYAALLVTGDDDAEALVDEATVAVLSRRRPPQDAAALEHEVRLAMPALVVAREGRRAKTRGPAVGDDQAPGGGADDALTVRRALRALSPIERACVVMRHHDGASVLQIGRTLGMQQAEVRARLHGATGLLAPALGVADPGMEPEIVELRPAGGRR